jgi:hypothetical protein
MATFIRRMRPTTNTNFNALQEVNYWAKKFEVTPHEFKKVFMECGQSMSATIQVFNKARA